MFDKKELDKLKQEKDKWEKEYYSKTIKFALTGKKPI